MLIVIAGGGMVGGELAKALTANKHDVVVIDRDKDVCDRLYAETGVVAVQGNSSQIEVLKSATIAKADILVAATVNDADNLACAIMARSFGVPRIIVRMRDPAYENAYKQAGVDAIVRVTDMMVNQLLIEVEQPRARNIACLLGGMANIVKVIVPPNARIIGKRVKEIAEHRRFPKECIFIAMYDPKSREFAIPRGNRIIRADEELYIIANASDIKKAIDFITKEGKK